MKSLFLAFLFLSLANVTLAQDTIHFQLCAELWKDARPIKGATLTFQPTSGLGFSFLLDTSRHCADVAVVPSNYPPDTRFSYSASLPDTNHLNGVNIVDICMVANHVLGLIPLPSPYSMVAADVNKSLSISTLDVIESRKLIFGIYKEFPNNTAWHFISDYCEFPNPSNPFQAPCPPDISLADLSALDGDTAKVFGIKIGDVDGDAGLNGKPFVHPIITDSLTLLLPEGPVLAGSSVSVPVSLDKDFLFGGLQFHFFLDPALAQFESLSSGEIFIANQGQGYGFYNQEGSLRISILSSTSSGQNILAGQPLFFIHLSPLQNVDLKDILKVVTSDPNAQTFAIGEYCQGYYKVGAAYSGFVPTNSPELKGLRVQPPSPNPFGEQTFLEIELESTESAVLEVVDLTGRIVFSEEKNLPSGVSRWEIPGSVLADGSLGIWRLRVVGQMVAGKITRY